MSVSSYRVRGVLLATRNTECFLRSLDVADVEHDQIDVDLVMLRKSPAWAAQDAAWIAANGYGFWRWQDDPAIEDLATASPDLASAAVATLAETSEEQANV